MRKLFLGILFNAYFLSAQNTGQLSGRILDQQTQLPIQGVSVILEGTAMGVATNEEGYFTFRYIPTQTYNLTISHLGYQTQTVYNIIVKTFGTPPLQILLEESTNELEEIVVPKSFRTTVETPLSTQTFSAVEIETYPGGNNDITKVIQSMPGISLLLVVLGMTLSYEVAHPMNLFIILMVLKYPTSTTLVPKEVRGGLWGCSMYLLSERLPFPVLRLVQSTTTPFPGYCLLNRGRETPTALEVILGLVPVKQP